MLASRLLRARRERASGARAGRAGARRRAARSTRWTTATATCCASALRHPLADACWRGGAARREPAARAVASAREFLPPSDEGEVRVDRRDGGRHAARPRRPPDAPDGGDRLPGRARARVLGRHRRRERAATPTRPRAGEIQPVARARRRSATRSNVEIADDLRERLDGHDPGHGRSARARRRASSCSSACSAGEEGLDGRGARLRSRHARRAGRARGRRSCAGVPRRHRRRRQPRRRRARSRRSASTATRSPTSGLTVRDVTEALETAVAGSRAGEYRAGGNSYRILVQLADAEKRSLDEILDLTLRTPAGEHGRAAQPGRRPSPAAARSIIERTNQQRLVTVHGRTSPGATSARWRARCRPRLDRDPAPGRATTWSWPATSRSRQEAFHELVVSLRCWRWCSSTWCSPASTSRCAIRWS